MQSDHRTKGKHRTGVNRYVGKAIELANLSFLGRQLEGKVLNICCGYDNTGDVLVDLDGTVLKNRQGTLTHKVKVRADIEHLPFRYGAFETIVCDPDYSFYGRFGWLHELFKVASKKVILSAPPVDIRPPEGWTRELYYIGSNHIWIRLWWVFTKT
jgi:hypothetical protein